MRATVKFLISSLVFASLTVNFSQLVNDNFFMSSTTSQNLVSLKPKPQRNEPEGATPVRGSGRRSLMESQRNTYPTV
ncbi:heterocyst-inhibiting protein PatX [Anabaena sp. CCY 9402-a]|uniref:heterocyst-inhibiting protein PatX n=1 Tax=unclassified Anabaena TaxID=2619674 RepID=UPI0039C6BF0F